MINSINLSDIIADSELIGNLKLENFQLAITEFYDYCPFGLFDLLNIRTYIVASAIGVYEQIEALLNVYASPSHIPSCLSKSNNNHINILDGLSMYSNVMNFDERTINWYKGYRMRVALQVLYRIQT